LKLINAIYDADELAYIMKCDTIHGKYNGTIEADGDSLAVAGHKVACRARAILLISLSLRTSPTTSANPLGCS
jgi:glyceraldehyde-3-phosphate dehydrogenase/erythrose-4-phosphate dehydrogenase